MMRAERKIRDTEQESVDLNGNPIKIRQYDKELSALANLLDEPDYGCLKLTADQAIPNNSQTTILFNTYDTSESTTATSFINLLEMLDLSYSNGIFTNTATGSNTLCIHYHLRFANSTGTNVGYRMGLIVKGAGANEAYARSSTPAITNEATHVSNGTVLRLKRSENFSVKAYHNNGSDLNIVSSAMGSSSKLVIAQM